MTEKERKEFVKQIESEVEIEKSIDYSISGIPSRIEKPTVFMLSENFTKFTPKVYEFIITALRDLKIRSIVIATKNEKDTSFRDVMEYIIQMNKTNRKVTIHHCESRENEFLLMGMQNLVIIGNDKYIRKQRALNRKYYHLTEMSCVE